MVKENGEISSYEIYEKGVFMTTTDIRSIIKQIKKIQYDCEAAHSTEDELLEDVLKAIAEGAQNPQELAKEALKVKKLDFARWCA